eukprot:6411995-Prymnesium_polylepis.1
MREAPIVSIVKELTLDEALAPFEGLTPIKEAPEWLAGALTEDDGSLLGRHVIFKWLDWGFAVGKLGA